MCRATRANTARLQIIDHVAGPWGNVGVDHTVFSDRPLDSENLDQQRDFGEMAFALLDPTDNDFATADDDRADHAQGRLSDSIVARVGRTLTLAPGESAEVNFLITWRFPNFYGHPTWLGGVYKRHWYAAKFNSARAVVRCVAEHFDRLAGDTRRRVETWYDSTLPYWLLDRTMANSWIPGHHHLLPVRGRPVLGVGRHRLLPRDVYARVALRPSPGSAVPGNRTRPARACGLRPLRSPNRPAPSSTGRKSTRPILLTARPDAFCWQYMYFNECMTGFEWQVAAHMIWEGIDDPELLEYGLAVSRAIDDRYDGRLHNPYNEIECSDHYARAMASYGVHQTICGFNCHSPAGHIEFDPRRAPDDLKAPFTCATGWGTLAQQRQDSTQLASVTLRWGSAALRTPGLQPLEGVAGASVQVRLGDQPVQDPRRVKRRPSHCHVCAAAGYRAGPDPDRHTFIRNAS
jgi:hypothetical protein